MVTFTDVRYTDESKTAVFAIAVYPDGSRLPVMVARHDVRWAAVHSGDIAPHRAPDPSAVDFVEPVLLPPGPNAARRLLDDTDYLIIRAQEPGQRPLSAAWLAWREALREVARGNATAIPDEPERYA